MQQNPCSRGTLSSFFPDNRQACGGASVTPVLPFRCPRCGEQERFRSLASLRAHLEYSHSYHSPQELSLPLPARRGHPPAHKALHVRSLSDTRDASVTGSERRRTQSVGTQADEEAQAEDEDQEEHTSRTSELPFIKSSSTSPDHYVHFPTPPLAPDPVSQPQGMTPGQSFCGGEVSVRRRLASVLRAADSSMQRRLTRVSTELAQTDTELLCERAHSQHLAQERQEVLAREQALSRQVDVAVMVIATLREQLNASEDELERREQEVLTIQRFLEAAAQQEQCGKVRIQHFIENLLQRIALAERLLEYYQSSTSTSHSNHYMENQTGENRPHRISKSRPGGGQLSSPCPQDGRINSTQLGRSFPQPSRERLAQSSGHCRPGNSRDQFWRPHRRPAGYEA
ncbi:protein ZNF365 [Hypomesus transpacificus]|uniref:protein ZNF365 n=1 Tax=Hypomesus transpacificus TaxID=137520 RepID=UPI001F07B4FD|nr:protein ZNF365 [Hypomesus transpacificus]